MPATAVPRTAGELASTPGTSAAFQLVDDVLDFTAASRRWEAVRGDLREGKVTLPLVYALDAPPPEQRLVGPFLRQRSYEEAPFTEILALLDKYQGIERVKERPSAFTDKARAIINEFPNRPTSARLTRNDLWSRTGH